MKFEQAISLIQDGDIISFLRPKNRFSLIANIISWWTKSLVYHDAIAIVLKDGIFVIEADPSDRKMVPLTNFKGQEMHVIAKPDYVDFDKFKYYLFGGIDKVEYSFTKCIDAGLRKYFYLPRAHNTGEICSELCAKMWQLGGYKFTETLLTPDQLEYKLTVTDKVPFRVIIEAE